MRVIGASRRRGLPRLETGAALAFMQAMTFSDLGHDFGPMPSPGRRRR
jgi:hypothetical protein